MAENQKAYTPAQRWEWGARHECGVHAKERAWRISKSEKEQEKILKMHKIKAITKSPKKNYFWKSVKEQMQERAKARARN
jgi:formylmethanofuran dehydrogenase subunit E